MSDEVVAGGEITLDRDASRALIGLPYQSELGLLPLGASQLGAWAGKPQRHHELIINLYKTMESCEVGREGGEFVPVADLKFHPIIGKTIENLRDQDLEHQHRIVRWMSVLGSVQAF